MRWVVVLAAGLVLAAGDGLAQELADRTWGFGWDRGLTLRRQLGDWQIGVSAGPQDWLSEGTDWSFDSELPDSLQALPRNENEDKVESGFVRLHLARLLAERGPLRLSGLFSGKYDWEDRATTSVYRRLEYGDERVTRQESFSDTWTVLAGVRLAWQPVPWLTLEQEWGLLYAWDSYESRRWSRDLGDESWSYDEQDDSKQKFDDFGPYDLTYDVQICFWF